MKSPLNYVIAQWTSLTDVLNLFNLNNCSKRYFQYMNDSLISIYKIDGCVAVFYCQLKTLFLGFYSKTFHYFTNSFRNVIYWKPSYSVEWRQNWIERKVLYHFWSVMFASFPLIHFPWKMYFIVLLECFCQIQFTKNTIQYIFNYI